MCWPQLLSLVGRLLWLHLLGAAEAQVSARNQHNCFSSIDRHLRTTPASKWGHEPVSSETVSVGSSLIETTYLELVNQVLDGLQAFAPMFAADTNNNTRAKHRNFSQTVE